MSGKKARKALLKALGDGSGHETRDKMSTVELVETLVRKYRRAEDAARTWQKHSTAQADQLSNIKTSLLEACLRPNPNLSPEQLADGMAPMIGTLRDMLADKGVTTGLRADVIEALALLEPLMEPEQAKIFAEKGVPIQAYARYVAGQLTSARSTVKNLNRVIHQSRKLIHGAIPIPLVTECKGYLPNLVGALITLRHHAVVAYKQEHESRVGQNEFLGKRIEELTIDTKVQDRAAHLIGAAGDEDPTNQELVEGLLFLLEQKEKKDDQSPDPDPTAIPA